MALLAKYKLSFVDDTIFVPTADDLFYSAWVRCNSMICSWLINSVSKKIADSIIYLPIAFAVWNDLRDRFRQNNLPRVFQIKKQLDALHQCAIDVTSYFTQLKIIREKLVSFQSFPDCDCRRMKAWLDYQKHECILHFLIGMIDSFSHINA